MALPTDRGYPTGMMNYNPNGTGSSLSGSSLNYGVPSVDGGGMGDFLSQMWKKKLDDSEYAKRRADDDAMLERWKLQQSLAPNPLADKSKRLAVQEQEAALLAKDSVAPKRWVQIGPSGYWADDTDQMTSRQRDMFMPAAANFVGGGITSGATLSPDAPTAPSSPFSEMPQWLKEQLARNRSDEMARSLSARDQGNALQTGYTGGKG